MNLTPDEAAIVRRMLDGEPQEDDDPLGRLALRERLNAEAPPLGARVFRLVCELGGDAAKKVAANTKERKALRESMGRSAVEIAGVRVALDSLSVLIGRSCGA